MCLALCARISGSLPNLALFQTCNIDEQPNIKSISVLALERSYVLRAQCQQMFCHVLQCTHVTNALQKIIPSLCKVADVTVCTCSMQRLCELLHRGNFHCSTALQAGTCLHTSQHTFSRVVRDRSLLGLEHGMSSRTQVSSWTHALHMPGSALQNLMPHTLLQFSRPVLLTLKAKMNPNHVMGMCDPSQKLSAAAGRPGLAKPAPLCPATTSTSAPSEPTPGPSS